MATGTLKDKDYDLISLIYHASQGLETCHQYSADAKQDGDDAVVSYFAEAEKAYEQLVQKGKELLKERL